MRQSYNTVFRSAAYEWLVDKSKFIGRAFPVATQEEAETIISEVKDQYRDATHNVYAYQVGIEMPMQKANDDGEPNGTAGKPILEVIKNKGLTNVLIVVTRYFGGKRLGAGGLIRAYSQTAARVIEEASESEKVLHRAIQLVFDFNLFDRVKNKVEREKICQRNLTFTDRVRMTILVPSEEVSQTTQSFSDLSSGTIQFELGEENYYDQRELK